MQLRSIAIAAALGLASLACSGGSELTGADASALPDAVGDAALGDAALGDTALGDTASDDGLSGDGAVDTGAALDTRAADTAIGPVEEITVVTLLDEQPVAMVGGYSQPISVEIPPDVISVTISVLGSGEALYGLGEWIGPDGSVLVTPGWTSGDQQTQGLCLDCPNRIALSEGAFAALAPNNPEPTLAPGTHVFTTFGVVQRPVVQDTQGSCGDEICTFLDQFQCPADCSPSPFDGEVLVSVHAKLAPGAVLPDTGVLNLNLHFTGAGGWTADTAPTDAEFQALLDTMRDLYAQVGITLGELRYIDIDSGYQVIESVQGPNSDLMEMFKESEGDSADAVGLFFVEELSAGSMGGFGVILGISGGIPGPPLVQGTLRSGVAIAVKEIAGVPAGPATTMAHETGHFLGLYHTSEQNFGGFGPQINDPLPDTPDNDDSYLMFNTGAGSILSPWQGIVMRSNPWIRHEGGE